MEAKIKFLSDGHELEGRLEKSALQKGVVITHPHPLYGGNMNNNVVEAIGRVYRQSGYTTLRFNFRGVGNSQGSHGNGIGEQADVHAAVSYLTDLNIERIDLAGYSFGAWVNARFITSDPVAIASMLMVSPPVRFIEFGDVSTLNSLKLVVTGSRDEIAPPGVIRQMLTTWNLSAHFDIIDGSDHFYNLHTRQLEDVLGRHI